MDDFPFSQEPDRVADVRILYNAKDIVVRGPRLLLRRQIFEKIRERISLGLKLAGVEGNAARRLGPDPRGMIDLIRPKALLYQLLRGKIAGQLVDNGGDHLQMRQLLGADIRQHRLLHPVGHRVPLGQIPHGSAHLPIRSAGWP